MYACKPLGARSRPHVQPFEGIRVKILLRVLSILPAAIGLFLLAAVVNAVFIADEGARVGVGILYVVIAMVLFGLVALMWRVKGSKSAPVA